MIGRLFARALGCYAGCAPPAPAVSRPLGGTPEQAGAGSDHRGVSIPCGPSSSPAPAGAQTAAADAYLAALNAFRANPYAKDKRAELSAALHARLSAELGR